uniref:Immunoglobulin domain-containing protein n=1 Tax=Scleropages formosus TaxID=113540 RepID=A0A8C9QWP5_SCLFO
SCILFTLLYLLYYIIKPFSSLVSSLRFTLLCVSSTGVSCSHLDRRFEEAVLRTVQPGDNVTLCCDVKNEQKIVWYRQCSHENQPAWEIPSYDSILNPVHRYSFIWNSSSDSFDLRIENITESDLGVFYCATKFTKVETRGGIVYSDDTFNFGNVTISLQFAGKNVSIILHIDIYFPALVNGEYHMGIHYFSTKFTKVDRREKIS